MTEDHYKILGVPHGASLQEIKDRFHFLAHAYHPDKFTTPEHKLEAEREFKNITASYRHLSHQRKSLIPDDASHHERRCPESHTRREKEFHRQTNVSEHVSETGKTPPQANRVPPKPHAPSKKPVCSAMSAGRSLRLWRWSNRQLRWAGCLLVLFVIVPTLFWLSEKSMAVPTVSPPDKNKVIVQEGDGDTGSPIGRLKVSKSGLDQKDEVQVLNDPQFIQAGIWMTSERKQEAYDLYEMVSLKYPDSHLASIKVAFALGELHTEQEDLRKTSQSVVDNPMSADAWLTLGRALQEHNLSSQAIFAFRRAVWIEADFDVAWVALGESLEGNGEMEEAIRCFRQAAKINPQNAASWQGMGLTLHQQGKLDDAVVQFRKALEIQPENPDIWNQMGVSLMGLDRSQDAADAFRKATQYRPTFISAWNNLGICLKIQGEMTESTAAFRQVQSIASH